MINVELLGANPPFIILNTKFKICSNKSVHSAIFATSQ